MSNLSNLLAIPFKNSYNLDLKEPARRYLQDHTSAHPDSFKVDINRWQELRRNSVGGTVHKDGTDKMNKCAICRISLLLLTATNSYHAQLLSILTKLPSDVGVIASASRPTNSLSFADRIRYILRSRFLPECNSGHSTQPRL